MNDNVRVGLIGYGYASKTFHAPLIAGTPGMELAVISSSDAGKVHADWPGMPVVSDPKQLFNDPHLDLIVIPTPNDTHFPLAKPALEAGKHVVVDKPFTVTLSQARKLETLAKSAGLVLSVFHNRRWDSDFLTLKQIIAEGQIGEVVYFESHFDRFRPQVRDRWREQAGPGSGIWYDLAPHLLDQAVQLFGLPVSINVDPRSCARARRRRTISTPCWRTRSGALCCTVRCWRQRSPRVISYTALAAATSSLALILRRKA